MPTKKVSKFFNLYNHGFIRAAVCIPEIKVADTFFNTQKTIELAREAASNKAILAIFPELGLSAIPMKICSIRTPFYRVSGKPLPKLKKLLKKLI